MTEVQAIGFVHLSPYCLRVILVTKGYPTHIYTGEQPLQLSDAGQNIVIVPNVEKRFDLQKQAGQIYRMVLLTKEYWRDIVKLGVPILDATISGDRIEIQTKGRKVQQYVNEIERRAVPISLVPPEQQPAKVQQPVEKKKPATLKTLNEKLDFLMQQLKVDDFDRVVEQPICTYLVGELNKSDLEKACKALLARGGDAKFLKPFYQWLTGKAGDALSAAAKEFLWPSDQQTKEIDEVAERFHVDANDLDFVAAVYQEMQTPISEGETDVQR